MGLRCFCKNLYLQSLLCIFLCFLSGLNLSGFGERIFGLMDAWCTSLQSQCTFPAVCQTTCLDQPSPGQLRKRQTFPQIWPLGIQPDTFPKPLPAGWRVSHERTHYNIQVSYVTYESHNQEVWVVRHSHKVRQPERMQLRPAKNLKFPPNVFPRIETSP